MSDALIEHEETVRPEWIDYNGHMNFAYYVLVFDHATDVLFDALGIGSDYCRERTNSNFVLETHTLYEREVGGGDRLRVRCRLLDADASGCISSTRCFTPARAFAARRRSSSVCMSISRSGGPRRFRQTGRRLSAGCCAPMRAFRSPMGWDGASGWRADPARAELHATAQLSRKDLVHMA